MICMAVEQKYRKWMIGDKWKDFLFLEIWRTLLTCGQVGHKLANGKMCRNFFSVEITEELEEDDGSFLKI